MSNPSFSNIDRWLFELNEGNLSPEQIQQLELFLLQHPELDVDKDMWELARVEKTEVVYPDQDKFIKRKPVGLFMMAGFASIAIFVLIGINVLTTNLSGSTGPNLLSGSGSLKGQEQSQSNLESKETSRRKTGSFEFDDESINEIGLKDRNLVPAGLANAAFRNSNNAISVSEVLTAVTKESSYINEGQFSPNNTNFEAEGGISKVVAVPGEINHERSLNTKPVKELDVVVSRNWSEANSRTSSVRVSASDQSESFSSRIIKASRALSRMMDNPVALKNLKDPSFHLPGMLPADVNFGNTGTIPATRIQTLTRLQWPKMENQQLINQIAFDSYVYPIRGGIGAQVNHAYYGNGEIMNSNLALTYSPKISVNRNILIEPSVRFKMGNKTLDQDKIDGFGLAEMERENVQQFYPTGTAPIGQQLWYRDLGLGMMVNTKWFFVGVQGDNLFRHYDNIYSGQEASSRRVDQHFIATIGTDYESKRELIGLSPYFVYQQSENLKELWMGVNTRLNWFTVGLAVSDRMDAVASAGVKFEKFAFSYQADYTHSALWDKQLLSHQVSLKFTTFNTNKKQKFINL